MIRGSKPAPTSIVPPAAVRSRSSAISVSATSETTGSETFVRELCMQTGPSLPADSRSWLTVRLTRLRRIPWLTPALRDVNTSVILARYLPSASNAIMAAVTTLRGISRSGWSSSTIWATRSGLYKNSVVVAWVSLCECAERMY